MKFLQKNDTVLPKCTKCTALFKTQQGVECTILIEKVRIRYVSFKI